MKGIWTIVTICVVIVTVIAFYELYGDSLRRQYFGQGDAYTVYVNQVAFDVSVADTDEERKLGLSGTAPLATYHGKLFIFDTSAKHGFWMKDMQYPIDILWFNDQFKLVHVASNVTPDSYPAIFAPRENARFVLEINARAAETLGLTGQATLTLPSALLPGDLKNTF